MKNKKTISHSNLQTAISIKKDGGLRHTGLLICLVLLCAFLTGIPAQAAITPNGTATSTQTAGALSLTWSHTVASGTNRVLFVELSIDGLGAPVTGVTYGGVALTQVGRGTGNHAVEIWRLVNPAVGTANVVVNFSGTTAAAAGATCFNGVNQATPNGTFASSTGTGTTASVTVSSAAGDQVVDVHYWQGAPTGGAAGAGQTINWWQTNAVMIGGSSVKAGASPSVTMSGSFTSSAQWDIGAVSIKPAATSLSGNVFEDLNYGGGAGRDKTASSGVSRSAARVELYDNAGAFVTSTSTDVSGNYSFSGLTGSNYTVRVVNSTVTSSRTGYVAGLLPVMTYRTDASSGSAVAVTDYVGGQSPAVADAGNGAAGSVMNTATGVFTAGISGTAQSISAITFGVTNITGVDFGFNFDSIVNINDSGQGSLRQFITNANTLGGDASLAQSGLTAAKENAVFMISNGTAAAGLRAGNNYFSAGVATVSPVSALPNISTPMVIDAQKQPGWATGPVFAISGGSAGAGVSGLVLVVGSGGSIVRGLIIQNFTAAGINVSASSGNTIAGNWIGLNTAGTAAAGNNIGINIWQSSSNIIGGTTAADRNVISGSSGAQGINISDPASTGNQIRGNYIGTNAAGTAAVGNKWQGLYFDSPNNTIGGSTAGYGNVISGTVSGQGVQLTVNASGTTIQGNYIGLNAAGTAAIGNASEGINVASANNIIGGNTAALRNVISGNNGAGIFLQGSGATGNSIKGNYIGTDSTGTVALGNGVVNTVEGVGVSGGSNNTIGGTAAGDGNRIWYNGTAGVAVQNGSANATGNAILGNSISGNISSVGIDLSPWGVTTNNGTKNAALANYEMDFPVFTSSLINGTTLTVNGYVGSAAGQATFASARVEIFKADNDPSGYGEGQTYLGFLTADASGNFSGTLDVSGKGLSAGDRITGTATDALNNTSEFGVNATVNVLISGTVFEDVNYGGGAGRNFVSSSGVARQNARIEVFDNSGALIAAAVTNPSGGYSIPAAPGSYTIRVVPGSVTSTRTGYVAGLLPVMTYRTNASSGSAVDVTDYVGGHDPATADAGNAGSGWILNSSTGVFSGSGTGKAHAFAPVTVSAANVSGIDFGFNFDTVVNTNDSGQGSLRQFITNANTLGGDASLTQSGQVAAKENAILMISNGTASAGLRGANNYFTSGTATISLTSPLPNISTPMVINAQKQPGWTTSPIIELNGTSASTANGLTITSGNSVVRGFVINRFDNYYGIQLTTNGGNTIAGNYIGLSSTGAAISPTLYGGIGIDAGNNTIGGTAAADRNIISGGRLMGINLNGAAATGNSIQGNFIGTNAAGNTGVANETGISIANAAGNTIGGTAAGAGNLISGSTMYGISLSGASNTTIQGNSIGTNAAGTGAVANQYAFYISASSNNTIGGTAAGAANIIARNSNGLMLLSGTGNLISANSIFSNTNLGIDLNNNGISANNGTKNAALPNYDMDFPVFSAASLNANTLTVSGYVGSAAGQATFTGARVEIFKSDNASSGYGQGQTYLGFLTSDASGNFSGSLDVSGKGLVAGDKITGTATDGSNNTSEFGANKTVVGYANLTLALTGSSQAALNGELLYSMLITNNGPGTANNVTLTNVLPASVTLVSANPSQGSCSGSTTITCDLGSMLNTATASVEILVVTTATGTITDNASVSAPEIDTVPADNSASVNTQVVAGISTGIPLTLYRRIHGFVDSTVTGGSLRTAANRFYTHSSGTACSLAASSTATLSGIPASATIVGAYLYWAGSGSTVDSQVSLDGTALTADRTFTSRFVVNPNSYDFFGGVKDVTAQVQAKRNGSYTFSGLTVDTTAAYCNVELVLAGWSMFVIYSDNAVSGKTIVLYDGFDIRRNNSVNYNLTGIFAATPPEAKTTMLVWEGDPDSNGESIQFNGSTLSDALNPATAPFNSTINTLGSTTSYGVDLDSFDVSSLVAAKDTLATTTVTAGPDMVILNAVLLQVKSNIITGTVFEDVNFGGGAGRTLAAATAAAPGFTITRPGTIVELYDSTGAFLRSTTTDGNGLYGFAGMADGDYTVRAVTGTVTSARTGSNGNERAIQTFRTDASSATAVPVTDYVGGTNPQLQDSPTNVTNANLASIIAQSTAPVKIITGVTVNDVNFGFNFDTIVNRNDAGPGSLRQFILNANSLGNAGLAQAGLTAGSESAIFMISDGNAHPGLRAGLANQLTGGVAVIQPLTALPAITDAGTVIDGNIQTATIGDTNPTGLEVEISGGGTSASGLSVSGAASTVLNALSIYGFSGSGATGNGIYLNNASSTTIYNCNIGANASGMAALANSASGIAVSGTSTGIAIGSLASGNGNLIAYNGTDGISLISAGSGTTIRGNTIRNNTWNGVYDAAPGVVIAKNLIRNNGGAFDGIWVDAGGANAKIYHNTVHGNGRDGIRIGDTGTTIRNNLVTGNGGYGINRIAAAMTESYNGVTDAATIPANALGRSNVALDSTDLNVNPLYVNAATGNFALTECTSPAINNGIDLGADQPDMNGAAAGLWNNNAPDIGAFESSASCSPNLAIIKQAWDLNGTIPRTSLTAPVGSTIAFLIYVKNPTSSPVSDLRIIDSLDESAFQYMTGSMLRTSAAAPPGNIATDLAIFTATAPGTGTVLSDALDADVASALDSGGSLGVDRITIGAVPGQSNASLTLAGRSTFALRFNVKIK